MVKFKQYKHGEVGRCKLCDNQLQFHFDSKMYRCPARCNPAYERAMDAFAKVNKPSHTEIKVY